MKKIEVILKVTESCNLRCKYCYNAERPYSGEILSLEKFEKLLRVLLSGYNLIHIIWHGGEPLLAGIDYFKSALDVERRIHIETGVVIENSIQTNATLINAEWIRFFKKHDFRVGISFDGINNDKYRQGTERTLKAFDALRSAGLSFGCNAVVADNDYDLKANYEFFKKHNLSFDFSRIISEGGAKNMPSLATVDYANAMCNLFDEWLYDKNGVSVRTFALYLNLAVGGKFRICSCASCHTKYISITPDGMLYNCARDGMRNYPFGNIDDFSSAKEIFASEQATRLILGSIERRNKCKQSCEYFSLCAGGCADVAIVENGIENIPTEYCHLFKTLYSHINSCYQSIIDKKIPLSELNPAVKGVLARSLSKMNTSTKSAPSDTYV